MANRLVAGFPGIIKDKVPESLAVSEEGGLTLVGIMITFVAVLSAKSACRNLE